MIFIQSNKRWWVILLKLLALLISILQVQIHKTIFQKQEFLKFGFLSKICVWQSYEHFSRIYEQMTLFVFVPNIYDPWPD